MKKQWIALLLTLALALPLCVIPALAQPGPEPPPQAKAEDVRYGYMYRHKMPVYVYQIPVEDGAGYEFFVPASMEGASYCLLTSSEEMFPVPHYVYLKDGS